MILACVGHEVDEVVVARLRVASKVTLLTLAQDKGGPSKGGFLNHVFCFIYGSIVL